MIWHAPFVYVLLLSTVGADFPSQASHPETRQLVCDVEQRGFHLNLHCLLNGPSDSQWGQCVLKVRLSRALYADPYELAIRHPELNFTLAKPRKYSHESTRFGKWFSWFTGSDPYETGRGSFDQYELAEAAVDSSAIDVESSEWLAEPMTLNLYPPGTFTNSDGTAPDVVDIPLHLRYRLPNDGSHEKSLESVILPHPMLKCADGDDYNTWDNLPPLDLAVSVPPTNDLLYVMPVTILLLTVGVIVLLVA